MVVKLSHMFVILVVFSGAFEAIAGNHNHNNLNPNGSTVAGIKFPDHMSFNAVSASGGTGCSFTTSKKSEESESGKEAMRYEQPEDVDDDDEGGNFESLLSMKSSKQPVKFHLKRRTASGETEPKQSVTDTTIRDLTRIQTLHRRRTEEESEYHIKANENYQEYFMDVFVGTPPKHFSLILDTGSDLNWIQCVPCYDCFEQNGPYYDPKESTSFRNISCEDPRCKLVSSPDPPQPCKSENQTCPYYYWYGDSSNTTGDFSLETFTVNLTTPSGKAEFKQVENVMFGCGHWNRGPLEPPGIEFHLLGFWKRNPVDTFYYVQIKSIMVGGEVLKIPEETWHFSADGGGGTIIDSGTTLSYFAEPANHTIKEAFRKQVKGYEEVKLEDFPLDLCYNVSGVDKMELPDFSIQFSDGAVWNFPVENYFIKVDPHEVVCLAILGTPKSALSIIGNYQQQNFHILYDTKKSRLGYAPMNCADV
ncbi:hypothetical protein FNV43_RR13251 [Rhamnella rubrinervis]|uniref:Peptidase A1 domain-containing protein n=1 Tax=Rhamnella rubrinervis TaxID=2594499 RepID=A0A8K0H0R1_9ROSA|nr:hypothetical protein FNV43_RR13251 [Rhamnella rubrinervis]